MNLYDPYDDLDYTLDPDDPGPIPPPARTALSPRCSFDEKRQWSAMALAQWRQMRLLAMERAGFNHQIAKETELDPATCAFLAFTTLAEQSRVIELMYRYDARCDDRYDRALTRLFEAQKRRKGN